MRQKLSSSRILSAVILVLLERSASCSSLLLMMSSADGTGIEVNNAVTSEDVHQNYLNCKEKLFPDRPEEAAMFGCESLSTEII